MKVYTMRNSPRIDPESRGAGFLALVARPEPEAPRNGGAIEDEQFRALAESMWADAIAEMPSLFSRLEFLAGLRSFTTGEYAHYGLELAIGREPASELARRTHIQVFLAWLRLDLTQQVDDISLYLSSRPGTRRQGLEEWSKTTKLLRLVPEAAAAEERSLFLLEVQVVMELLAADYLNCTEQRSIFVEALLSASKRCRLAVRT